MRLHLVEAVYTCVLSCEKNVDPTGPKRFSL
jgi:hypothetical protein